MHLKTPDTRFIILAGGGLLLVSIVAHVLLGSASGVVMVPVATTLVVAVLLDRHRAGVKGQERHKVDVQALVALSSIVRPRAPLPPMSGWACTPELAVSILCEHLRNRPGVVVEAGSGASTVVNGYMLERVRGKLHSLDHDREFAEQTREHLRLHGLSEQAKVYDAPLIEYALGGENWLWYDVADLDDVTGVELLVVDGPPVSTQPLARYPALPLLADKLADRAVIILDDAARKSEQGVVERWLAEYPDELEHVYLPTTKGTSVLTWSRNGA